MNHFVAATITQDVGYCSRLLADDRPCLVSCVGDQTSSELIVLRVEQTDRITAAEIPLDARHTGRQKAAPARERLGCTRIDFETAFRL